MGLHQVRQLSRPVLHPVPAGTTHLVESAPADTVSQADLDAAVAKERQRLIELQHELTRLVKVRLPAALAGDTSQRTASSVGSSPQTAALLDEILAQISDTVLEREESRRLAVVELAGRMQTSAHRIQQAMSGLAEQHPGDPDLLETTMRVDHAATQQARHAQSVKVLCDEWPGQQWPAPLPMVDVVRAASGRIVAFNRVQVSGDQTVAAVPVIVEPLIHLLAELLANATEYSAPSMPVTVSVRGVQRGAVIEIDDSGFGLDEYRLGQAREVVSGRRSLGLSDVGEIPQTGFAVVGRFARRHGFTVDLGMSPYGGVRAVVLVPSGLVETVALPEPVLAAQPDPEPEPQALPVEQPAPVLSTDTRSIPVRTADPVLGDGSEIRLPQRRSARRKDREPVAGGDFFSRPVTAVSSAPDSAPDEAGDWMERFFEGSQPIQLSSDDEPSAAETPADAEPNTPTPNIHDVERANGSSTARKDPAQG